MSSDYEKRVEFLIDIYNNRKRTSMKATPFSLFFLCNSRNNVIEYIQKNNKQPSPEELIENMKDEWKKLPLSEKELYLDVSGRLGFKYKQIFERHTEMKAKVEQKLNLAKKRLGMF